MLPGKSRTLTSLKKLALSHPGVEEGIACAGTSLETLTFNVRGKSFLFVAAKDDGLQLRLKVAASLSEAQKLAKHDPTRFEANKNGWVKLTYADDAPPADLLQRWIGESYALYAKGK
jgi:predicted DNA-binding protein (MmcQ/YjbR family)